MNFSNLKTPGVYIDEISKFPPSVAQVETAIPAFIGYTAQAKDVKDDDLLRKAVRIKSFADYELFFGGAPKQAITVNLGADGLPETATLGTVSNFRMYHSVKMFYDNGGGPCYIISVGNYSATADVAHFDDTEGTTPGGLTIAKKVDEITLLLFPDAQALGGPSYYGLYQKAIAQCENLQDRFTIVDLKIDGAAAPTNSDPLKPISYFRDNIGNSGLKYAAAYFPWVKTTLNFDYDDATVTISGAGPLNGMTLAAIKADTTDTSPADGVPDKLALLTTGFMAKMKSAIQKLRVDLPPGALIAGVYAYVDNSRGVWKAPANIALKNVVEPLMKLDAEDQEGMNIDPNGKSVNAIRAFVGSGILVWGARTLAGNDNEWRYISVRRFYNMVEETVKNASRPFVFEPNDANTWVKVKSMVRNYLTSLWRQGALAGAKPEDAFYVYVGLGETMTALDILEGRMIVEIGMAAVRPAEFIILRFAHKMQES